MEKSSKCLQENAAAQSEEEGRVEKGTEGSESVTAGFEMLFAALSWR
jgi:hypothetical protein